MQSNIGNIYQDVAPLANAEGLRTLAAEVQAKQKELEQRDADVFKRDAEISRLQARHATLNAAAVSAANAFRESERTLMDALIDSDTGVETIAQDHEAKRANHEVAVAGLKHVVTVRSPRAALDRLGAFAARQLAFAQVTEAQARFLVARKLQLLEPVFTAEGSGFSTQGGLSEDAIREMSVQYENYAKAQQAFREAQTRFESLQIESK